MPDLDDLRELIPDWRRSLRARNVAPSTETSYTTVADAFVRWLVETGQPTTAVRAVTRQNLETYLVHVAETPNRRTGKAISAAQVAKVYRTLQQFVRWLVEVEEIISPNPFDKLSAPAVPDQPVDTLSEDQLRALIKASAGREFEQLRDTALIRLFLDTGARCGEVAPLRLSDLDFNADTATVLGKGRRERTVPFGNKTGEALRRYLRARARQPMAAKHPDALWLGRKGVLTEWGIRGALKRRAETAGVPDVHPHRFRHTFAHQWLADGNQEQDLLRLAGWRSREMLARYGASAADERARNAHKRAALGDRI
jgi:site-specific recombinase XerD